MGLIYEIACSDCGNSLKITLVRLDCDGDLFAEVKACPNCIELAKKEGQDEVRDAVLAKGGE